MQNLVDEDTEKVQPCLPACKSQTHEVTLSHSAYPNEHLIPQLEDFCFVLEKIISKSCKSSKRKVMDQHFEEFVISCRFCDFMDNLTAKIDVSRRSLISNKYPNIIYKPSFLVQGILSC